MSSNGSENSWPYSGYNTPTDPNDEQYQAFAYQHDLQATACLSCGGLPEVEACEAVCATCGGWFGFAGCFRADPSCQ